MQAEQLERGGRSCGGGSASGWNLGNTESTSPRLAPILACVRPCGFLMVFVSPLVEEEGVSRLKCLYLPDFFRLTSALSTTPLRSQDITT